MLAGCAKQGRLAYDEILTWVFCHWYTQRELTMLRILWNTYKQCIFNESGKIDHKVKIQKNLSNSIVLLIIIIFLKSDFIFYFNIYFLSAFYYFVIINTPNNLLFFCKFIKRESLEIEVFDSLTHSPRHSSSVACINKRSCLAEILYSCLLHFDPQCSVENSCSFIY